MKVPHEAMQRFLDDARVHRQKVAEAEARDAAAALAREVAAIALVGGEADSSVFARATDGIAAGLAAGGTPKVIDRVFDHLARPTISAPWEELAQAARELGLDDLSRALDRLSRARGTSDETPWRIAVALAAHSARTSLGGGIANGFESARLALASRSRVEVHATATLLSITDPAWILTDSEGSSIYLGPSPMNSSLVAILAEGEPVGLEAVAARDEFLGAVAVVARIGSC